MDEKTSGEIPPCPYCQNALQPERLNAGKFLCSCCARVYTWDQVVTFSRQH